MKILTRDRLNMIRRWLAVKPEEPLIWQPHLPRMNSSWQRLGRIAISGMAIFAVLACIVNIFSTNGSPLLAFICFVGVCVTWIWMIRLVPTDELINGLCMCDEDGRGRITKYYPSCEVHGGAMMQERSRAIRITDEAMLDPEIPHDEHTWVLCRSLIRNQLEKQSI